MAQASPANAGVTVHGEVFDSVHAVPLAGATVMMNGSGEVAVSDNSGRFVFHSVTPGPHTFTAYHAAVDSAGFAALSSRVDVVNEQTVVRLALPSFRTLWGRICQGPFAADSGFVTGVVRDAATRNALPGANVELVWLQPRVDSTRHIRQTRWRISTTADSSGAYALCGIPIDAGPNIQATRGTATSGIIDMLGSGEHVLRRDLYVAPADPANVGTITGTVSNPDGSPFADARVVLEGTPEVRSGRDGRFTLRNVPAGTRELEVLAVGLAPTTLTVDVFRSDTSVVNVTLRRVTTLDVVRVIGSALQRRLLRGIEDRRKIGLGRYLDSTQLAGVGTLSGALASFPSVVINRRGSRFIVTLPSGAGRCNADLFVDGIRQVIGRQADEDTYSILDDLRPDDIALVEVYAHGEDTPMEFASPWSSCGVIAVWTKSALHR
jgi:hypothetical protein